MQITEVVKYLQGRAKTLAEGTQRCFFGCISTTDDGTKRHREAGDRASFPGNHRVAIGADFTASKKIHLDAQIQSLAVVGSFQSAVIAFEYAEFVPGVQAKI